MKISTPSLRHADRVLELRRQRAVARHRGPAVGQHLHMRAAEIDHRLDGEEHAGPQHDAFAGRGRRARCWARRGTAAEAVAAEVAHHAHVLRLDEGLDRGADVAGGGARPDHGDAAHHGLIGDLDQPLGAARDFADRVHAAGIAVPAVEDQRHVDVDDVAVLQRLVVGDAVADHVVDRGAGRLVVAAIHQRRRQRAVVEAKSSTSRSSCSVVTPGFTSSASMSRHSATSRPALRMPSKASLPCSLKYRKFGSFSLVRNASFIIFF